MSEEELIKEVGELVKSPAETFYDDEIKPISVEIIAMVRRSDRQRLRVAIENTKPEVILGGEGYISRTRIYKAVDSVLGGE